jgi:hypothetical protein
MKGMKEMDEMKENKGRAKKMGGGMMGRKKMSYGGSARKKMKNGGKLVKGPCS